MKGKVNGNRRIELAREQPASHLGLGWAPMATCPQRQKATVGYQFAHTVASGQERGQWGGRTKNCSDIQRRGSQQSLTCGPEGCWAECHTEETLSVITDCHWWWLEIHSLCVVILWWTHSALNLIFIFTYHYAYKTKWFNGSKRQGNVSIRKTETLTIRWLVHKLWALQDVCLSRMTPS